MVPQVKKKYFGLVNRKERWGLSLRGWLALSGFVVFVFMGWLLNVQPFLAQTKRVDTNILVVEGWVRQFGIKAAVQEAQTGHYQKVYTTGGPLAGTDGVTNDYNTAASVGAEWLVKDGMPAELVQMVPSHVNGRDRTYSSAVALREWFREHNMTVTNFVILTEDVHARRSRLLFQEAFGDSVQVGVIAVRNPDYEPSRWWRYSEGVREVLGESIAYVYAKFLFHPPKAAQQVP
jgi:uncharacterized SAM-binding protein YcdF (DUF218 family)